MSMLCDKNKNALVGVALAQTASDFSIIQDPDCAAVLCQTQISSHILAWIASLDPACLPKARVILRPDQVQSALVHICDMSRDVHFIIGASGQLGTEFALALHQAGEAVVLSDIKPPELDLSLIHISEPTRPY